MARVFHSKKGATSQRTSATAVQGPVPRPVIPVTTNPATRPGPVPRPVVTIPAISATTSGPTRTSAATSSSRSSSSSSSSSPATNATPSAATGAARSRSSSRSRSPACSATPSAATSHDECHDQSRREAIFLCHDQSRRREAMPTVATCATPWNDVACHWCLTEDETPLAAGHWCYGCRQQCHWCRHLPPTMATTSAPTSPKTSSTDQCLDQ